MFFFDHLIFLFQTLLAAHFFLLLGTVIVEATISGLVMAGSTCPWGLINKPLPSVE